MSMILVRKDGIQFYTDEANAAAYNAQGYTVLLPVLYELTSNEASKLSSGSSISISDIDKVEYQAPTESSMTVLESEPEPTDFFTPSTFVATANGTKEVYNESV